MPIKAERLNELMQLAQDRFNNLSDPERKLLQKLANGKEANYSSYDERPPLRASLIAWLCTDVDACKFITHQGLTITGAAIKGFLNLKSATLEFPLRFQECCFTRTIDFSEAKLKLLDLSGSQIVLNKTRSIDDEVGINADDIHVGGDVLLSNGFTSNKGVIFYRARIDGDFDCSNSKFDNDEGDAITANNIYVGGNVVLSDGFSSNGELSFYRAKVDGDFDCSGGIFNNDEGDALTAQSIEVKGSILFIGSDVKASRIAVLLTGSEIGRDLECEGTRLYSEKGSALLFESGSIGASVFFWNGFEAHGQISLCGTAIGRALECSNSVFENFNGRSLVAENFEVKGSFLTKDCKFRSRIWFENSTVRGSFECIDCELNDGIYIKNTIVEGSVKCISSRLIGKKSDNIEGYSLLIQNTRVRGSITLGKAFHSNQKFESIGQVSLDGTTIGGNFECSGGTFQGGKCPLLLLSTKIGRSILFLDCTVIGAFVLINATVNDFFTIKEIHESNKMILDLRFSNIRILSDLEDSWPQPGNLLLDGLVYEVIHNNPSINHEARLKWLRLQHREGYSFQPYEQLAQVLRESGHEDSAKDILIAKKRDLRRYKVFRGELKHFSFRWLKDHFLEHTIAYGYKPFQVLPWMGCFIAIGTLLLWLGYLGEPKLISPARVNPFHEIPPKQLGFSEDYPKFNPFFYSIDAFIPILNLHQQDYWLPNANREKIIDVWPPPPICSPSRGERLQIFLFKLSPKFKGAYLRWYLWFHIFAGWILTSLFVAGLTGLVRRIN